MQRMIGSRRKADQIVDPFRLAVFGSLLFGTLGVWVFAAIGVVEMLHGR